MTSDHDDPEAEDRWCDGQRKIVADYLCFQGVEHGPIDERPAWHVAPYVSIWAVESRARPGWVGWWVICGDLPADYISSADVEPPQHPRKALRVFARSWLEMVQAWRGGREVENARIGDPSSHEMLGPLLEKRAGLLMKWADDDSLWEK